MITARPLALAVSLLLVLPALATAAQDSPKNDAPVVTLLERGAEPHAPLRLRPETGAECHREVRVNMSTRQGPTPAMNMPEMRLTLTTKVESVDEEGEITYTTTFVKAEAHDKPGVNPMMRQQMSSVLAAIKGMRIKTVMNDRGVLRTSGLDSAGGINPMVKQQVEGVAEMIERFSAPLPAEAVGVGAKWKVESTISRQGMELKQTATYTLKANRGGTIELAMELAQDAEPQEIKNPMMPPGASMRLLSYHGEGSGTLKLNLSEVIHSESGITLTNVSKLSMSMAGQTQEMEQHMESEMSLSTVDPPKEETGEKREGE